MLTAVLLLLLPAVLSLSVYRLYQLPRAFALALGFIYAVSAAYTAFVLFTAVRAIWTPPRTIQEFFSIAYVGAAYPFVCLAFEWVLYYAVTPRATAQTKQFNGL